MQLQVLHRGVAGALAVLLMGASAPCAACPNGWRGFGGDAQHTAVSAVAAQPTERVHWSTPVDLQPQYSGTGLLIHYGTPLVTRRNTVLIPVKTGPTDGFQVEARRADTGALVWTQSTDYTLPAHGWVPSLGATLTRRERLIIPGAGGTIYRRVLPDRAGAPTTQRAFYGIQQYQADPSAFNDSVRISTPITADLHEAAYFGFVAADGAPLDLQSGVARVTAGGGGAWTAAATAAGDTSIKKVAYNCAPALSKDETRLYVAVTDAAESGLGSGYLLALDSRTLSPLARVRLKDVAHPHMDALVPDDGTASPTVGPDGDVYFGVLENPPGANHLRGWLLHFDAALSETKTPGAFGWDNTASIVPASAVPSYTGASPYLLMTKYNNYAQAGGDGVNKFAILDPNASMTDPISGAAVMREVLTVAAPTPDADARDAQHPDAVKEWCINTGVVDPQTRSAVINNEDGFLYRWDFTTNTLAARVQLSPGLFEAYTPTIIGPDGTVFAISNGILFAVGETGEYQ
jgi:predicted small secreted protein